MVSFEYANRGGVARIRRSQNDMPLAEFKALVREQYLMLLIDPDAALAALPAMMPPQPETRQMALALLKQVLAARGEISDEVAERLQRVAQLFEIDADRMSIAPATVLPLSTKLERQVASSPKSGLVG